MKVVGVICGRFALSYHVYCKAGYGKTRYHVNILAAHAVCTGDPTIFLAPIG